MAALAYVLLPFSGVVAFFLGSSGRVRFHGLQAIFYGTLWAVALYGCSAITPGATQICFVVGSAGWLVLMIATALGKDPHLPGAGKRLADASGL